MVLWWWGRRPPFPSPGIPLRSRSARPRPLSGRKGTASPPSAHHPWVPACAGMTGVLRDDGTCGNDVVLRTRVKPRAVVIRVFGRGLSWVCASAGDFRQRPGWVFSDEPVANSLGPVCRFAIDAHRGLAPEGTGCRAADKYLPHASHVAITRNMTLTLGSQGSVNHWLVLQLTPSSLLCNETGSTSCASTDNRPALDDSG